MSASIGGVSMVPIDSHHQQLPPQSHPLATLFQTFHASLDTLCLAAGPPAPSFSLNDIDSCISEMVDQPSLYQRVFASVDKRLQQSETAISVRAMLWQLLTRFTERTWTSQVPHHEDWCTLLAPQLYRIIMLVLPKSEDATPNVSLTRSSLMKWMAQAETAAGSIAPPFKRHQLLNAIKYVEGYVYEPPPPNEAERLERKERKRAKKRREREAAEESRKKKLKKDATSSAANPIVVDDASRTSSPSRSPNSAAIVDDSLPHSASSSPRDPDASASPSSPSSPVRLRYLNRTSISHTASEEAAASRFLENIRASQKRTHVEGSLRPAGESQQGWEEWEETRAWGRRQRMKDLQEEKERLAAQLQLQQEPASTSSSTTAATFMDTTSSSTSTTPPSVSSAPTSVTLETFLSSWLLTRNHWKATRDAFGESNGQLSDGGYQHHEADEWLKYYQMNALPLPSATIPSGANRCWSKLNETGNNVAASSRYQGPLLPKPAPLRLYQQQQQPPPQPKQEPLSAPLQTGPSSSAALPEPMQC